MRTDDLRFMPHVRALVPDRGLDFRNSFSPNPICAPARSTLLSGQYSHNTSVLAVTPPRNYAAFDDRATVATSLNQAGYNTVFLGKYLNGYGVDDSVRHQEELLPLRPARLDRLVGLDPASRRSGITHGGTYNYFDVLINHNGTLDDSHKGTYQATVQGRIARHMVTSTTGPPKPFLLYFAPIAPHFGAPREKDDPRGVVWPGTGPRSGSRPRPAQAGPRHVRQADHPGLRTAGGRQREPAGRQRAAAPDAVAPADSPAGEGGHAVADPAARRGALRARPADRQARRAP